MRVLRLALSLISVGVAIMIAMTVNVVVGLYGGWVPEALLGVFEILVLILILRGDDR